MEREVTIAAGRATLIGNLAVPEGAEGLVLFAHGSGSSRLSSRNVYVARQIQAAGIGTLLFDLLTREEEAVDLYTRKFRFDIPLLASRMADATRWVDSHAELRALAIGYFGASTGSAAALIAAAAHGERVSAVVSRGGRPDLAEPQTLARVKASTLFIVGERDDVVIEMNREAYAHLTCEKAFEIVPRATHLFEEPGTLEAVASLAAGWFERHLHPQHTTT